MDWLDNIKIGKKLIGSFIVIVLIMIIIGIVGYLGVVSTDSRLNEMYDDQFIPTDNIENINAHVWELRGDAYRYMSLDDVREKTLKSINENTASVDSDIKNYEQFAITDEEKNLYKKIVQAWGSYHTAINNSIKNVDNGKIEDVKESLSTGELTISRQATSDALKNVIDLNLKKAKKLNDDSEAAVSVIILQMLFAIILSIVIALTLGFLITRSITVPLARSVSLIQEMSLGHLGNRLNLDRKDEIGDLTKVMDSFSDDLQNLIVSSMKKVGLGDLSVTITPKDDNDEISPVMINMVESIRGLVSEAKMLSQAAIEGNLSIRGDTTRFQGGYREVLQGFNATLDSVINPVNEAMRLSNSYADGDFTDAISENISLKGDFIQLKEALNKIGIQISNAIGGVKDGVESLNVGMEETNASAEEVASTSSMLAQSSNSVSVLAEKSGSGVRQTLTAMDDLSNTVSSVATKAEQASSMAKQTVDLSEKGVMLAGKAEKGMEGIMQSVDETSVIITDITSQMDEIGKIVEVITGIAEQTGLLALNAAIEAARAGDAGMGFAVVADEVKSLALESQKSAENIATIIGNLQKKSQKVSESMKVSASEVKSGNEAVSATLDVFNEIVQAINIVHNNMTEVAGATEEQAAAVEEITASVHEVGGLVQQTAKEAVDSAAATEEVTASIDQITRAISEASASIQRISVEMSKFTTS